MQARQFKQVLLGLDQNFNVVIKAQKQMEQNEKPAFMKLEQEKKLALISLQKAALERLAADNMYKKCYCELFAQNNEKTFLQFQQDAYNIEYVQKNMLVDKTKREIKIAFTVAKFGPNSDPDAKTIATMKKMAFITADLDNFWKKFQTYQRCEAFAESLKPQDSDISFKCVYTAPNNWAYPEYALMLYKTAFFRV